MYCTSVEIELTVGFGAVDSQALRSSSLRKPDAEERSFDIGVKAGPQACPKPTIVKPTPRRIKNALKERTRERRDILLLL